MSTDAEYNGWTNYPTWCANLWIANDEGLYGIVLERTQEIIALGHEDERDPDDAPYLLSEWLKELFEIGGELVPALNGLAADLLGFALGMVDWSEIAGHLIDDERAEA